MNSNPETRAALVSSLREAADFFEQLDPRIPIPEFPISVNVCGGEVRDDAGVHHALDSKPGMALILKAIGQCEKEYGTDLFALRKKLGILTFGWIAWRHNVCERVKVGTRVVAAQAAVPESVVDVYEYECPSSILAALPRPEVEMSETKELPAPFEGEYLPAEAV